MNVVTMIGNLTRDPELRHVGDSAVCKFGIAWNERRKKDGEWVKVGHFFDVETWNGAEACAQHLSKGREVALTGQLHYHSWTTDTGEKRSKVFIKANRVDFIGKPSESGTPHPDPSAAKAEAGYDDDVPF
jgi:single-strand DNA-binding protein